jgi:hypothetical protein
MDFLFMCVFTGVNPPQPENIVAPVKTGCVANPALCAISRPATCNDTYTLIGRTATVRRFAMHVFVAVVCDRTHRVSACQRRVQAVSMAFVRGTCQQLQIVMPW